MRRQHYPRVILGEDIDFDSLAILLSNGLSARCHNMYEEWRTQRDFDEARSSREEKDAVFATRKQTRMIYQRLEAGLAEWLAEQAVRIYP